MLKIFNMLNEYEMFQSKLGNIQIFIKWPWWSETESDITAELIQLETGEIVLNESTSQLATSEKINKKEETKQNTTFWIIYTNKNGSKSC